MRQSLASEQIMGVDCLIMTQLQLGNNLRTQAPYLHELSNANFNEIWALKSNTTTDGLMGQICSASIKCISSTRHDLERK